MAKAFARGYFSSDGKASTASANTELIPAPPVGWTEGYEVKKVSFINHARCTIIINKGLKTESKIVLEENRGFESGYEGVEILSFIIEEAGIEYEFIMAY